MKLVRDKIPEIIKNAGESDHYNINRCSDDVTYREKLLEKIKEEAAELSSKPNLEEMADVMEVVLAIAKNFGYSKEDVEKYREKKKEEKGGFEAGYLLEMLLQEQRNS